MPDTALLRLCAEFQRLRAAALALPIDEIEGFCFLLKVERVMSQIILAMRPTTTAGRRSAAAVAIAMLEDGLLYPSETEP
jgi:hypothetical protein